MLLILFYKNSQKAINLIASISRVWYPMTVAIDLVLTATVYRSRWRQKRRLMLMQIIFLI